MTECSICMNGVKETRNNKPLECGHLFHASCIASWINKGKHTCPLCRDIVDKSKYKVTIRVENIDTCNVSTIDTPYSLGNIVDRFGLNVDDLDIFTTNILVDEIDNSEELQDFLHQIGTSVADINTVLLYAE